MKRSVVLLIILYLSLSAETNLSVADCRKLAVMNNHDIKISESIRNSAKFDEKAAFAGFLPKFDISGTYQRVGEKFSMSIPDLQDLPVYGLLGDGSVGQIGEVPLSQIQKELGLYEYEFGSYNNMLISGSMEIPVFTGGKIYNRYRISKDITAVAVAGEKKSLSEVYYKVDEYFWELISLNEKVRLCMKYNDMIESHIKDLENYLAEGIITNNELLKAKVLRNDGELQLSRAENGVKLANMALCQIIGLPLDEVIIPTDTIGSGAEREFSYESLRDIAEKNRPELTVLQRTSDIAESKISIVKGTYLPNIVLNANYNLIDPDPYSGFEDSFGSDWMVGITCTMEIFNFNRRWNELQSARLQKNAADSKLEQTREMINLDVQNCVFNIGESKKRIALTESSLAQAEENLKITGDYFTEGIVKSSEVLDAQTMWQKAYSDKIDALYEYELNVSKLNKAVGELYYNEEN